MTPDFTHHRTRIFARFADVIRPRKRMGLREWSARRVVIPEGQPKPGPFRHLVPAADGIMAAIEDPAVNTIVIRAPVQMMKTTLLVNTILWLAAEHPSEMLIYQPDDELAGSFLSKRLDPIAQRIPAIAGGFAKDVATRDRTRTFPGGDLIALSGLAQSPEVARSAKYIFIDEYRKFRDDLYQSIRGRMTMYAEDGAKLIATSSAGEHGACRTTALLNQSDMREWRVPCLSCDKRQKLAWDSVKWVGDDPDTAVYVCNHCHCEWTDDELREANRAGTWRATRKPDRPGLAGFDCNFLASPFVSMTWAVGEWLAANAHMHKTGSEAQVRAFVRDFLAEPYRPGAGMKPEILNRKLRISYPTDAAVPDWVTTVTLCIDVQDNRLEYEYAGWRAVEVPSEQDAHRLRVEQQTYHLSPLVFDGRFYQYRRAGLEYGVLPGDPGLGQVWEALDEMRTRRRFAVGEPDSNLLLRPQVALIDSGGHCGEQVKAYVCRVADEYAAGAARGCPVYPVKGASTPGQPLWRNSPSEATRVEWGGYFLLIGVDGAKDWCHAMVKQSRYAVVDQKTAVYPVLTDSRGYGLKYFEGLCSESKQYAMNRYGQARVAWTKDPATANEPLDLYAYSLVAVHQIGLGVLLEQARRAADLMKEEVA